jgi:hypothetical protein
MSAKELLNRLTAVGEGESFDWRAIREEIHRESDGACTSEDRVILLRVFQAVFDRVERELAADDPDKLPLFRNARLSDYRLLLTKESLVGQNVCADTLYAVTEREVAAGRMAGDDELRQLAEQDVSRPHPSRADMLALAEKEANPRRRLLERIFHR